MLSVSDDISKGYRPYKLENETDIVDAITKHKFYSTSIFKDGQRLRENFLEEYYIAFDIDSGWSIEEAKERLSDHWHVIAPTRNHQKIKHEGQPNEQPACDRFRVILKLTKPITDAQWHKATWLSLKQTLIPSCDDATKDTARCFYSSEETYSTNFRGTCIEPVEPKLKEVKPVRLVTDQIGDLCNSTLKLLQFGAEPGTRNQKVYNAASDMRDQGYTYDDALRLFYEANDRLGIWAPEEDDRFEGAIQNAYSVEGEFDKRLSPELGLKLETIDDIYKSKDTLKWTVDGLLSEGGLSLIAGMPKSGKSTIVRQLAKSISRGEKFLNRDVNKGRVLYLAIEEQREMLKSQLRKIGVNANDDILMHVGPINNPDVLSLIKDVILDVKPTLVIIDTIMLFLQIEDINNYSQVNPAFAGIRNIARETGAHIMGVHHQNKSMIRGTTSVMGSVGIHGAVDNLMIFDVIDENRHLTTSQRGGKPFTGQKLTYNAENDTYLL